MARLCATLIGDVVASRTASDRAALHDAVEAAIAEINATCSPTVALRITVGDEYQGCFATVGLAARATLRLRLALAPGFEVRHGIGWGTVRTLAEEPRVEDGPGWWVAREAIEHVAHAQTRAASRTLRTAYRRDGEDGPDPDLVNAVLVGRDELLAGTDERSVSVLSGMLEDMSQQEIAQRLGVSASAVSQRVRRDGLAALVTMDRLLGGSR
ncbi:SatD family protein [Nocardioides montaniterrae]